jgi:DNA-binding transcriptional ArsR family regulator
MSVNDPERVFHALASLPRRRIVAFLAQTAAATTDLAARFGLSAPAVSRHLSVLQQAGLVSAERQGQKVLYRLEREALLGALARFASEVDGPLRRGPREAI